MFSKILFPTDFSAAANRLLECLDTCRPLGTEEVVLLHVEEDVGMIALCTHGRSAIRQVLLSSVSQKVIRSARQLILILACAKLASTPE